MRVFITGDTHGGTSKIEDFCRAMQTTKEDILVILGDVCINYDGWYDDHRKKERLENCPVTLFMIHGNHEMRPDTIPTYKMKEWCGGKVWYEEEYPSLLFAKDGEFFDLGGKKAFVVGGAYSVDKKQRYFQWLCGERSSWEWWPDEQPSLEIKTYCEQQLAEHNWQTDIVLTHTCPQKYLPKEAFLVIDDGEEIDSSTEEWLDWIEEKLTYETWYCGHFHIDKDIDKMKFLFDDFAELPFSVEKE